RQVPANRLERLHRMSICGDRFVESSQPLQNSCRLPVPLIKSLRRNRLLAGLNRPPGHCERLLMPALRLVETAHVSQRVRDLAGIPDLVSDFERLVERREGLPEQLIVRLKT